MVSTVMFSGARLSTKQSGQVQRRPVESGERACSAVKENARRAAIRKAWPSESCANVSAPVSAIGRPASQPMTHDLRRLDASAPPLRVDRQFSPQRRTLQHARGTRCTRVRRLLGVCTSE